MLAAIGFALIALVDGQEGYGALAALLAGTIVMSLGLSPVFTIGNEMIITAAPPERAGSASAISETSSELSGALGIALFGSLGTALYRHRLAGTMPEGVPAEAAGAAIDTLGGAMSAAGTVSGALGEALLGAARGAFVDALQVTAATGAVIVIGASVVAARLLRPMAGLDDSSPPSA